ADRTPDNLDQWAAVAASAASRPVITEYSRMPQSGIPGFDSPMDHQKSKYPNGCLLFSCFHADRTPDNLDQWAAVAASAASRPVITEYSRMPQSGISPPVTIDCCFFYNTAHLIKINRFAVVFLLK
ncbi:MAG: hypothetical protein IJ407_05880, partial [Clostridia bacterium]|nr:hypothetical protein [Clostridia bacterium]